MTVIYHLIWDGFYADEANDRSSITSKSSV